MFAPCRFLNDHISFFKGNCIEFSATLRFFRVWDKFAGISVIKIKGATINYVLAMLIIVDTSSHTITSPGIS